MVRDLAAKGQTASEADVEEMHAAYLVQEQKATALQARVVGMDAAQKSSAFRLTARSLLEPTLAPSEPKKPCTRGPNGGPVDGCDGAHTHPVGELLAELSRKYKSESNSLQILPIPSFVVLFHCSFHLCHWVAAMVKYATVLFSLGGSDQDCAPAQYTCDYLLVIFCPHPSAFGFFLKSNLIQSVGSCRVNLDFPLVSHASRSF